MKTTALLFLFLLAATGKAQTMCDSLAAENARVWQELIEQRSQVEALVKRVENGAYDLDKARKEAQILRDLMKGYVSMIDSLHKETIRLKEELESR
jgi:hypothetical protein